MKWINLFLFISIYSVSGLNAQSNILEKDYTLLLMRYSESDIYAAENQDASNNNEFPSPRSVMFKSLIIPGWGQIENRQIWKVPIIYGMFAGVGYYTMHLHEQYRDYRAAFYNSQRGEDNDFRFGPTPERLEGINSSQLQSNRNSLRNQRDFMFVVMGLAYGLNAIDAYVFAHMRSFDVSDDLSAKTTIYPTLIAEGTPGLTISLTIHRK